MKKSKMVELLAEDLGVNYGLDFLTDYPEAVAKGVIEFLESKGMLPPSAEFSRTEVLSKFQSGQQVVGSFTWAEHKNQWEPEDD